MQRDALMPRPPGGMGRGLVLAIIAHLLLVAALSFGVNWHASVPDAAEAELWAAVPQAAAPRAAEPPPQPAPPPPRAERVLPPPPVERPLVKEAPDAQIALERERREQQQRRDEQKRAAAQLEKERTKQQQDAAKQVEVQAARLEAQRSENLKRIIGQAGGSAEPAATGRAAQSSAPSADYIGRIKGRIRPNVSFPDTLPGNPAVEIDIRLGPDGRILSSRVAKRSGAPEWDDAVLRAIEKTEILPRDENGRVPSALTIVYRPKD